MASRLHRRRVMRQFLIGVLLALAVALPVMLVAPPVMPADEDCKLIEDFGRAKVGEFPAGWKPRKDEGKSIYAVQEEGGKHFLRAVSKGLGIQAAREVKGWDLAAYPVLAWSWRPREFPKGSDERESDGNDSVLAVYLLVPHSRVTGPKAVRSAPSVYGLATTNATWLASSALKSAEFVQPLISPTGRSGCRVRSARATSQPVMPGMPRSVITRSTRSPPSSTASASRPPPALSTV